ncbi:hypothetical protein IJI17_03165 [Candidatus Saccharibacteria bacterium]|nr:hypothetical protein [Candidatus Saccharibacteria bacterium]
MIVRFLIVIGLIFLLLILAGFVFSGAYLILIGVMELHWNRRGRPYGSPKESKEFGLISLFLGLLMAAGALFLMVKLGPRITTSIREIIHYWP